MIKTKTINPIKSNKASPPQPKPIGGWGSAQTRSNFLLKLKENER